MVKRSRFALPHDEYKKLCNQVFERDKWRCKSCGFRQNLHAHHVKYRSAGGGDYSWNLLTVCNDCHDDIHVRKTLIVFASFNDMDSEVNCDKGVFVYRTPEWRPRKR